VGETLKPGLIPAAVFDRIACFEPVKSCCAILGRQVGERVELCIRLVEREFAPPHLRGGSLVGNVVPQTGTQAARLKWWNSAEPAIGSVSSSRSMTKSSASAETTSSECTRQTHTIFPEFLRPALADEIHWAVEGVSLLGSVGTWWPHQRKDRCGYAPIHRPTRLRGQETSHYPGHRSPGQLWITES
jgi:hypothetical protein